MSECRSCGAPVLWALTANGKRMPLDPEPVEGGNLVLVPLSPPNPDPIALKATPERDGPRYVSHFATCPNADKHRRRS